ncbi:hypothetical protein P0082_00530 [Candidatus Haliotispira prima]|uniref:Uncharacterized protein n=1 Tax=Candidatus Haliotispira prima TaxID=3034016 RepID=A0ABY8MJ24_9SPIO|nr:hypothetical protein P0082_00530 [Candidatus Haliotispira prima]
MTVLGIGKIMLDNYDVWNYPHLHVVLYKEDHTDLVSAFCIEAGVDAYARDDTSAFKSLVSDTIGFLKSMDKEALFDHLEFIAESTANDHFWRDYRIAETSLAKIGNDIGTKTLESLKSEIENLRRELSKETNSNIAELTFNPIAYAA